MLTLGNYLTPNLLGGKNSQWFTELIYTQFIVRFNWEQVRPLASCCWRCPPAWSRSGCASVASASST